MIGSFLLYASPLGNLHNLKKIPVFPFFFLKDIRVDIQLFVNANCLIFVKKDDKKSEKW